MIKADIVDMVHASSDISKSEACDFVETFFEVIKSTLERGESIKFPGFGNFNVTLKNDRNGRNPISGEAITITGRQVITFKPSAKLKAALNPER